MATAIAAVDATDAAVRVAAAPATEDATAAATLAVMTASAARVVADNRPIVTPRAASPSLRDWLAASIPI